ncbi:hypothetical protein V1477_002454 [Vespula maculifrons]
MEVRVSLNNLRPFDFVDSTKLPADESDVSIPSHQFSSFVPVYLTNTRPIAIQVSTWRNSLMGDSRMRRMQAPGKALREYGLTLVNERTEGTGARKCLTRIRERLVDLDEGFPRSAGVRKITPISTLSPVAAPIVDDVNDGVSQRQVG